MQSSQEKTIRENPTSPISSVETAKRDVSYTQIVGPVHAPAVQHPIDWPNSALVPGAWSIGSSLAWRPITTCIFVHTSQLIALGAGSLYRCGKTSIMNYLFCSALRRITLHFYVSAPNITCQSQAPIALVYTTLSPLPSCLSKQPRRSSSAPFKSASALSRFGNSTAFSEIDNVTCPNI